MIRTLRLVDFRCFETLALELPAEHPHHDYYRHVYGYAMDEHDSDWKSLLGYASVAKPKSGSWQRLSTSLDANLFPAADEHHLDLWVSTGMEAK